MSKGNLQFLFFYVHSDRIDPISQRVSKDCSSFQIESNGAGLKELNYNLMIAKKVSLTSRVLFFTPLQKLLHLHAIPHPRRHTWRVEIEANRKLICIDMGASRATSLERGLPILQKQIYTRKAGFSKVLVCTGYNVSLPT